MGAGGSGGGTGLRSPAEKKVTVMFANKIELLVHRGCRRRCITTA